MTARPAVAIRPATDADLPACADLHDRVERAVFVWDPKTAYGLDAFRRSIAGEEMTLAWVDSAIVGLISVYRQENFVHNLYVDLPWQGCGVGRQLLDAALASMDGAARLKCEIANLPARRFYEALGWREVARSGVRPGDWILYMHPRRARSLSV
jgi:ribosomal protein S18 acetylase RimI-like enzyme